jgi:non-heme chloroperoxidase
VLGNPANASRGLALTFEQFSYGWANALPEEEAGEAYTTFHVPASGVPLFQAATANLNPFIEAKVDTKNPDRGPLLIKHAPCPVCSVDMRGCTTKELLLWLLRV